MTSQSQIEYQTHFSLWSILSSPLIMGHDVRNSSSETLAILKNKEVISVNQYSEKTSGSRVRTSIDGTQQVFGKPLADERTYAVVLLNRAEDPQDLTLLFEVSKEESSV
jgi:alpha-galactosidase